LILNTSDVKTERSFNFEVLFGWINGSYKGRIGYGRRDNFSGILIFFIFM
jgi:hypothetical protein